MHIRAHCIAALAALMAQPMAAQETLSAQDYASVVQSIDYEKHTITGAEFLALRADGALVLDLRGEDRFAQSHIDGAVHLGSEGITAERLAEVAPDHAQTILIYCENSFLPTRMIALTSVGLPQFVALGYENVFMPEMAGLAGPQADGRLTMRGIAAP